MRFPLKRPRRVLQALAVLGAGALLLLCEGSAATDASPTPASRSSRTLPSDSLDQLPVALESSDGRALTLADTSGRVRIVSMFYASCPMVCPMTFETVRQIESALSSRERTQFGVVLVTIDPARDTPAALHDLARTRRVDDHRWVIARASAAETRALAAALDIRYRALGDGNFNHSTILVLLDRAGRIAARSAKMGAPDPEFVRAVREAIARSAD